jgi:very-short-patch-repair endonuclease
MQIPFEESFASSDKAQFWSSKNVLKPEQVRKSSSKKCWFDCNKCGHTFDSKLANIINKRWCPYCAKPSRKLCDSNDCDKCFKKSFASSNKAINWSNKNVNDKNELIKPREVFKVSGKKYLFDCHKCCHEITKSLSQIHKGTWCSYCSNQELCNNEECNECYEKSFASCENAKNWSHRNRDQPEGYDGLYLSPRKVFISSGVEYLFNCHKCFHEIKKRLADVNRIDRQNWCSYCSETKLCGEKECTKCFDLSFASSDKAKYWSNKNVNDKNELIKPIEVFLNSNYKYCFDCKCGHMFYSQLNNITSGSWCPYCAIPSNVLCDSNDCNQCFNKSFASSDKAKYWSDKNELKPREVFRNSEEIYFFNCKCGHTFDSNLANITKGNWCPYCSNPPKRLCGCDVCFEKSFASSDKIKYWSDENHENPRYVFLNSNKKYIFNCDKKHNFNKQLNAITRGSWCPYCVNKTEQILYDKLITLYPSLQQQFKADWCKKKQHLPFDFVISEYNIIIELDGRQHFEQVSNWASPEETQENDKYKTECANQNNYSVIRLLQEDVFYNTYNWLDELNQNIQRIISEGGTQNIYMCKNNEYDADVL